MRDGNLLTGGGVTAGIDFALTMVAEIAGPDVAQAIQLQIEYAPAPPFDAGTPESAPPAVLAGGQSPHGRDARGAGGAGAARGRHAPGRGDRVRRSKARGFAPGTPPRGVAP